MSDYLYDGEGPPDPEVERLSRVLGSLRYQKRLEPRYDAVREAPDPDAALTEFLESTYEAAAGLAGWDRAALERPPALRALDDATSVFPGRAGSARAG